VYNTKRGVVDFSCSSNGGRKEIAGVKIGAWASRPLRMGIWLDLTDRKLPVAMMR